MFSFGYELTFYAASLRFIGFGFKSEKQDRLGAASVVTIVAEKYDGQGVLVAANSAALGHTSILTPRLMELAAAHLAGSFLYSVQSVTTDDAGLQFIFRGFQVIGYARLFCHRYSAITRASTSPRYNLIHHGPFFRLTGDQAVQFCRV